MSNLMTEETCYNIYVNHSVASSSVDTTIMQQHAPVQILTLEIVQQMLILTFSALGLLGKPFSTSFPWYFDYQMFFFSSFFHKVSMFFLVFISCNSTIVNSEI